MKSLYKILALTALFTACTLTSCEKDGGVGDGSSKASKMYVTIQRYYNDAGGLDVKNWEKDESLAAFNASEPNPVVQTAVPATTGAQRALFAVPVSSASNGDPVMAWYPSDAYLTAVEGGIQAVIPTAQDGILPSPVFVGSTEFTDDYAGTVMTLKPYWCVLYAKVQMGAYSIKKLEIKANGGENIAGYITIKSDLTATASAPVITMEFDPAIDCSTGAVTIPVQVAPLTLSQGFTITYTTDADETFEYKVEEAVTFEAGGRFNSDAADSGVTQLLVCGDNMIYLLDTELAMTKGYKNAILWEWNAKNYAAQLGKDEDDMIRLDECKPVDNNTKILATASKGYAVLIDMETKDVIWYSTNSGNAHSAALLPNDRVAVACSDKYDKVQIFDIASSNVEKFSISMGSAHGLVWNPATERLYGIGNTSLNIFTLKDWNTNEPKLTLEKVVETGSAVTGLHDMSLIDDNTLLLAGNRAALYDIEAGTFKNIATFNSSTSLKSLNYNPDTGECWFTDPTNMEIPELTWASHTIRYTSDSGTAYESANFMVNDYNIYKVRVYKW